MNGQNAKKSFNYEQYEFHIWVENNFSFLIMTERGFKMRIAFACLEDLKNTFFTKYPPQTRDGALAYALNDTFSKVKLPVSAGVKGENRVLQLHRGR